MKVQPQLLVVCAVIIPSFARRMDPCHANSDCDADGSEVCVNFLCQRTCADADDCNAPRKICSSAPISPVGSNLCGKPCKIPGDCTRANSTCQSDICVPVGQEPTACDSESPCAIGQKCRNDICVKDRKNGKGRKKGRSGRRRGGMGEGESNRNGGRRENGRGRQGGRGAARRLDISTVDDTQE